MRIEQYFYAIEIADTGSFSQAARNLYVSQPNLSHAIKQLEQQAGFPLFVRTPSGVIPTAEGASLIDRFRVLKREYEQLTETLNASSPPPRLRLRVAVLNASRTMAACSEIIQRYIGGPISFSFMTYSILDELLPLVETGQVDFALIGTVSNNLKNILGELNRRAIEYHRIADASLCALVGPHNPLFQREKNVILTEDLHPYPIIQYGVASGDPSNSFPHLMGLSSRASGEIMVNSSSLFYRTILATPTVGLVTYQPDTFIRPEEYPDIRPLRLSDCNITAQFGWIKLRRLPLSDVAAELLDSFKQLF